MKRILSCLLLITLISSCLLHASAGDEFIYSSTANMDHTAYYEPEEVALALQNRMNSRIQTRGLDLQSEEILNEVLLPASLDIQTPKLDMGKIEKTILVSSLDSSFSEALATHNVPNLNGKITLSEYYAIEDTWLLPDEIIESAKFTYPELQKIDMSNWTYGMYKSFYTNRDQERLEAEFSAEQLAELLDRGIQLDDLMYLFKEFYSADNILAQPDAVLRNTLEGYYQFALDGVMASVTRATPPSNLYTSVNMPRYGTDWFLNDILTTTYWLQVQSDRTLRAQMVLYNSTSTTLKCTNMYGTYSQSQGGAHEGIDFVHPSGSSTPTIYALFNGVKKTTSTSHQLSVYDVNSPDEPKTYTFLHMSSITASSNVSAYSAVGKQGKEGNATGYHVHFEVHTGNTTSLSSGKDHELGSVSPYRLQDYIGELN